MKLLGNTMLPVDFSIRGPQPTLTAPISQLCTQAQFDEPCYQAWCDRLREAKRYHRKQWEFCYILQALEVHGKLKPGMRGVGYGVGREPLPDLIASLGCEVIATDLPPDHPDRLCWSRHDQHADSLQALNARGLCPPDEFRQRVRFECVDMNEIPSDYRDLDFTWSSCAFEHLGTMKQGLDFVVNSVATLKPGGIAVHTTEFNCSSNLFTLTKGRTVLYRRRDLEGLARRLRKVGARLSLNFTLGRQPLDRHVDMPPFMDDRHLKRRLRIFAVTSLGLIIERL